MRVTVDWMAMDRGEERRKERVGVRVAVGSTDELTVTHYTVQYCFALHCTVLYIESRLRMRCDTACPTQYRTVWDGVGWGGVTGFETA
jgi:hypothetical protein